jgi:putative DNA primase/helicase
LQYEAWVQRARDVRIEGIANERQLHLKRHGRELVGPCPKCGGTDRFAVNLDKQIWNCRGCERGGDVIDLIRHVDDCGFNDAVEKLTGEPPPKPNGKARVNGNGGSAHQVVVAEFVYEHPDDPEKIAFVVERIEYRDAGGNPILTKDGKKHKKRFRQKRPDDGQPGQWIYEVKGAVPVAPYRLSGVREAIAFNHIVVVVEGEAKADLLASWSVAATCNAGGAAKWTAEHAPFLSGADVVILGDNDRPGRKHVEKVGASLFGLATRVRVLDLPNLPEKGDILDWAQAGGTVERLYELIETTAQLWGRAAAVHDNATSEDAPEFSDDALALLFAERHHQKWRYVAFQTRWLFWDGCRWAVDSTLAAFHSARLICREQAAACEEAHIVTALASAKTVAAVERLAKADRRIAATAEQFDASPKLFNMPDQGAKS